MEQITTVGIDLAKNVFSLHGVDAGGKTVLRRTVRRDRLVETVAALSPCLIGMEACSGAHEWGRRVRAARAHGEADGAEVCSALQEAARTTAMTPSRCERIDAYDAQIHAQAKLSEPARRLMQIRGIGPTTALAIVATVGSAREFKNGRQFAAWIGLVPGQHSRRTCKLRTAQAQCRLTIEDRACGFHQGQSNQCSQTGRL